MTTSKEYWDDVQQDAKNIVKELKRAISSEHITEDDAAREFIDERRDINYIGTCKEVMDYTGNSDAIDDLGGVSRQGLKWREICNEYAAAAHAEDLHQEIYEQTGDLEDLIKNVRVEAGLDEDEDADADTDSEPPPSPPEPLTERERLRRFFFPRGRRR
jgi:hypothetical protein